MDKILVSMFNNDEIMVSNEENNLFTTIYLTNMENGRISRIDLKKEDVVSLIEMLSDEKVKRIMDLKAKGLTMDQINEVI